MKSEDNISDLGTRGASPTEIGKGSDWQIGLQWMRLPVSEWPVEKKFFKEKVPEEELVKFKVTAISADEITRINPSLIPIKKFSSKNRLLRVTTDHACTAICT